MQNVEIHILNTSGRLDELMNDAREAAEAGIEAASKELPLKNIDIVIEENAPQTIDEIGGGGGILQDM